MNLSKYIMALGAVALTVSGCGKTEKVVYMPATTVETPATTPSYPVSSPRDDFLAEVQRLYGGPIYVSDSEMLNTAYTTCDNLRAGGTIQDVIDAMNNAAEGDPDVYKFLSAIVVAGVSVFCPDQAYKFSDMNA